MKSQAAHGSDVMRGTLQPRCCSRWVAVWQEQTRCGILTKQEVSRYFCPPAAFPTERVGFVLLSGGVSAPCRCCKALQFYQRVYRGQSDTITLWFSASTAEELRARERRGIPTSPPTGPPGSGMQPHAQPDHCRENKRSLAHWLTDVVEPERRGGPGVGRVQQPPEHVEDTLGRHSSTLG